MVRNEAMRLTSINTSEECSDEVKPGRIQERNMVAGTEPSSIQQQRSNSFGTLEKLDACQLSLCLALQV